MEKDINYYSLQGTVMKGRSKQNVYKNTYANTSESDNIKQHFISNSHNKDLFSECSSQGSVKKVDWNKNRKVKIADGCSFKYHQTDFKSKKFLSYEQRKDSDFYTELIELSKKHPNDILLTLLNKRSRYLQIIEENIISQDAIIHLLISLGKACTSDLTANVHKLVKTVSQNSNFFLLHMQRHLVFLKKQEVLQKAHLDSIFFSTVLLEKFQSILPSASSEIIAILLPLLDSTCVKYLKTNEVSMILEKLKEINEKNQHFLKNFTFAELKKESKKEKLQLQEPPENFRSLSVLPTVDDIKLPCTFLRPNIAKGKYENVEHYLDVQYRLLREDFIQPLREGITEYLNQKKADKLIKNYKNVKVYYNVSLEKEEFVNGELLHLVRFSDEKFSSIKWESSKRLLTGSLLCFSLDDFETMLFASVFRRDPTELAKGLLVVRFEEITEVLKVNKLSNFLVIETSGYFEAYRHNLNALKQLDAEKLPLKKYIIDVEKNVCNCKYLCPTVIFDMRPLLIPLDKNCAQYQYPEKFSSAEFVSVMDESSWPKAAELNLDESQYLALKSAVTKEFSIIQGPPGTGKTYIGLRVVQLLLHNLCKWFTVQIRSLPILVVCFTNHALDQFLEGLLCFTTKICRIGGRGTNEEILKFNLSNLRKKFFDSYTLPEGIFRCFHSVKDKIKHLKLEIDSINHYLEKATKTVLNEVELQEYIPLNHYNSLIQYNKRNIGNIMYNWLHISESAATAACESSDNKFKNQDSLNTSLARNEKVIDDDEGDIEYIENQRNIDNDNYSELFNADFESANGDSKENTSGWKNVKRNKQHLKMAEYIRQCLEYYQPIEEEVAMNIECLWSLDLENRWQLYKYWLQKFTEEIQKYFLYLQKNLKIKLEEFDEIRIEQDVHILKKTQVIGVTTTGAAKYKHLIQRLNPVIVIFEEAAEVLESHVVTSLAPTTQHVILIGDHQQLRPSPAVHTLAVKYDMNISLFERMIKNNVDYCRLSIQHRMRPEIAALIVPHIYSNLENHSVVTKFENIKGVRKNVFFISHNLNELSEDDSKSKVNEHEARFIIQLCRYLILQGYDSSQITVLTTYTGQLFTLKRLVTDEIKKVRFTVVDNYQGEENDIILISFVRSNDEGIIGFLKVSNRVCVALSRAKKGLFCIGNFKLFAKNCNLWKNIVETLKDKESIGSSLQLTCQNHPDVHSNVSKEADFKNVLDGGCNQKCEFRLPCGHKCNLMCHPYSHELVRCEKPCTRTCVRGHPCKKNHPCYQECNCEVLILKTLQRCGHTVEDHCWKPEEKIICKNPCKKTCENGHDCQKMCFEFCGSCSNEVDKTLNCGGLFKTCKDVDLCGKTCKGKKRHSCLKSYLEFCGSCEVLVDKTLDICKHSIKVACGKKVIHCNEPCIKTCNKGHPCPKKCFEDCGICEVLVDKTLKPCGHTVKVACWESEYRASCSFQCEKILPCSHQCSNKCGGYCTIRCEEPCLKTCEKGHPCCKKCFEKCGTCTFIVDKTLTLCGHTVKAPCGMAEDEIKCSFRCKEVLSCSHDCTNKCGEPCVEICMQFKEAQSPICGHCVEVNCYIANNSELLLKKCKEELFKICSQLCHVVLPCGHKCKGTCGQCYQGRLHVLCNEVCERILICGHKCMSICSKSCPPCQHACENKCIHSKCNRKCSESCRKCTKACEWSCIHRKCTRPCNEICDCEPCNQACTKILKCGHPCIGFCSEPCPKNCRTCDNKEKCAFTNIENNTRYVLLEECKHVFEVSYLNEWMANGSEGDKEVSMKTCPICKTVIRKNLRYNSVVKNSLLKLEKVKQMIKWNKEENAKLQHTLLQKCVIVTFLSNFKPSQNPLFRYLSLNATKSIQELITIENIISITTGLKEFNEKHSESQILQSLIDYTNITCIWLSNFITKFFLTVSEYQLIQVTYEVHRLILINQLLKCAEPQCLALYSLDFENCSRCLLNYTSFDEASENNFNVFFQALHAKLGNSIKENVSIIEFPLLKAMNFSTGHWYECLEGHFYCFVKYVGFTGKSCYKCMSKCNLKSDKMLQEASRRQPPLHVLARTESQGKRQISLLSSRVLAWSNTETRKRDETRLLSPEERLRTIEIQTTEDQISQKNEPSHANRWSRRMFNYRSASGYFAPTVPQTYIPQMPKMHHTPKWPAKLHMRPDTKDTKPAAAFQAMLSNPFSRAGVQPAVTASLHSRRGTAPLHSRRGTVSLHSRKGTASFYAYKHTSNMRSPPQP